MLEIKKQVVELSPEKVMELEQIITDKDLKGAFQLAKKIYRKIFASQQSKLKSHLESPDPVGSFQKINKEV